MEDLTPQEAQSSQTPQTQVPSTPAPNNSVTPPVQTPEPKKRPWAIIIAAGILILGLAFYLLGGSQLFKGFIGLTPDELAGLNECVEGIPEGGLMEGAVYPLNIKPGCEVQFATTNESKAKILYNKIINTGTPSGDPLEINLNSENNLPNPKLNWSFGDGKTQENEGNNQASHIYRTYGEYTVTASASATVVDQPVTLTATKAVTMNIPQNPDYPVITPDSETGDVPLNFNSGEADNGEAEITFLSSFWADVFHADTAGLAELVNPITVHYGDAVTIITYSLDETAENIIQIRFNNKQWDLDIHAEEAAEVEEEEEDPIQTLKKMAETVADGGTILEYLLIDESFSNYAAKFHSIEGFAKNSKAILEKLKQFLAENKDVITSHEFDQVQGLLGLKSDIEGDKSPYTPKRIDGMIASLDSGLAAISEAKEIYSTEKLVEGINEEFLTGVLGFEDNSLQGPGCADALKNLQLTAGELNEEGEITLTLSPIGIPTPCLDNELQEKEIQMKKINGKYFPTYFSPGSKMTELDILSDAAKVLTPEVTAKIIEIIDNFANHFENFKNIPDADKNACKFAGETRKLMYKIIEDNFEGEYMPPYFFESFTTDVDTQIVIKKSFLDNPEIDDGEIKYYPLHGTVSEGHDKDVVYTPDSGFKGFDGFVYKIATKQEPVYYLGKNKTFEDLMGNIKTIQGEEVEPIVEKDKDPKGMKWPNGGHVTNALYCVGVGKAADSGTTTEDGTVTDGEGTTTEDGTVTDGEGTTTEDGTVTDGEGTTTEDGTVTDGEGTTTEDGTVTDGEGTTTEDGTVTDGEGTTTEDGTVTDGEGTDIDDDIDSDIDDDSNDDVDDLGGDVDDLGGDVDDLGGDVVIDGGDVVADGVVADGVVADDGGGGGFVPTTKIPVNETAPEIKTGSVTLEDVLKKFTCLEKIENPSKFTDTDDKTVKLLASLGFKGTAIIRGFTDIGKPIFDGSAFTNRAEILKTLMVSSCTPFDLSLEDSDLFKDIQSTAWYTPYVGSARKQDIVEGYESGKYYRPAQMVTRMEAIKMMTRISGIDKAQDSCEKKPFSDVNKNHWGYEISRNGFCGNVIAGKMIGGKRYLLPDAPMTRDEMAIFLYNFYVAEVGKTGVL